MFSRVNEVSKANQTTQLHPGQLFFQRNEKGAALGGIQTHDTLLSRRVLCARHNTFSSVDTVGLLSPSPQPHVLMCFCNYAHQLVERSHNGRGGGKEDVTGPKVKFTPALSVYSDKDKLFLHRTNSCHTLYSVRFL